MASLNPLTREVVFKIVFYGPGLGGKTTTLQHIHAASNPDHRGKMVSLATPMDRTLYFDFLPLRMPLLHGMHVRLQLFTVPGQVYYGATRKLVLTGADGVVFVADSQPQRQDANLESLEDLVTNLAEHNRALLAIPHAFHWNKRDLPDVMPVADMERALNRQAAPSQETVATRGDGVFEGLDRIARLVFAAYEADLPRADVEADRPPIEESTIADALRGLAEAPRRAHNTPPDSAQAKGMTPGPPSSLESIPNPIPRRPTGSFDVSVVAPVAKAPQSNRAAVAPASVDSTMASPKAATPAPPRAMPAVSIVPAVAPSLVPMSTPPPTRMEGREAPPLPRPSSENGHRASADAAHAGNLKGATPPFSLASLWAEGDRDTARHLEAAVAASDFAVAVLSADVLVTRLLAGAAGGSSDAPRDPALVVALLGIEGRRYLAFRAMVRAARARDVVTHSDALEAYAFAIEVRRIHAAIIR